MEQEASDKLVKRLGEQMNELFANLAVKQEEENTRLKEENQQMQRQLVEQNNRIDQQSNRMEQMMGMLMKQMGMELPDSPPAWVPASSDDTSEGQQGLVCDATAAWYRWAELTGEDRQACHTSAIWDECRGGC